MFKKRMFYLLLAVVCCMACTQELPDETAQIQSDGSISMQRLDFEGNPMNAQAIASDNGGLRIFSLMPNEDGDWAYVSSYNFGYNTSLKAYRTYMKIGHHKMYIFNTPVVGYTGYDSDEGYGSLNFPEMPAKKTVLEDMSDYLITLNPVGSRIDDGLTEYTELDSNAISLSDLYFPPYDLAYSKEIRDVETSTTISTVLDRKVSKLNLKVKFSDGSQLADNRIEEIVAVIEGHNRAISMENASVVAKTGRMNVLVGNPETAPSENGGGYSLAWNESSKCDVGEVLLLPNISGAEESVPQLMLYLKSSDDGYIESLPVQLTKKFEAGKQNNVTVSLKMNMGLNFRVEVDDVWEEQNDDVIISDKYELKVCDEDTTEIKTLSVTEEEITKTIRVQSNTIWAVSSSDSWMVISKGSGYLDGSFTVAISASQNTVARMGEITVTYGEGGIKKTILVEQSAASPNLVMSAEVSYISNLGAQTSVSYTSNASVEISVKYTAGSNWLTLASASGGDTVQMTADKVYTIENIYNTAQSFSLIVGCTTYSEGNAAKLYLKTISGSGAVATDSVEIILGANAVRIYENGVLLDNNQINVGYGWQVRRLRIETEGKWKVTPALTDNSKWLAVFPQSGTGNADIWVMSAANNDYNNYLNNNINFPEGRNADMKFSIYESGAWTSSTVLKVYQDAAYQSILTDVNTLEFPWNKTFGRTVYTIKQHIQVLACTQSSEQSVPGNNNTPWTAEIIYQDGSGWLHTDSPLTGTGPGNIELYCDDNTDVNERSAQIVFKSSAMVDAKPRKVIYISQNGKRAGCDLRFPVSVRYFEGSSDLTNLSVSGSGNWTGYSVPSFYMATYECTAQAYCDFLNDIGIKSNSIPTVPSGTYTNSINSEYKDIAIDRYPYTSQDRKEAGRWFDDNDIAFGGNLIWEPVTGKIHDGFADGIENSSLSGSYANYCMTGLSWCGAYEYAYWMNYYAHISKPSVPEGDEEAAKVMPSEAMWEYAARGGKDNNVSSLPIAIDLLPAEVANSFYSVGQVTSQYWTAWFKDKAYGATDQPLYNAYGGQPVGLLLKGENGTYDMVGNAGEWCFDWYYSDYPYNTNKSDPYGSPTARVYKVYRGGNTASMADVDTRKYTYPINTDNNNKLDTNIGFRPAVHEK